jgi:uncharacterized membrane protein (DUF4010 family)
MRRRTFMACPRTSEKGACAARMAGRRNAMDLLPPARLTELAGIALALALGLLVGLERGWTQRADKPGSRFAGIRTYGLFGLAGGVAGTVLGRSEALSSIILAGTAGLILLSYHRATQRGVSLSGTGSIVGLLTLACGFLAAIGDRMTATVIAVSMVLLLVMRDELHRLVKWLSEAEIEAIARFAAIAVVILPLLPDRAFGPYDAWNPRHLWMVVVLVSGISFAGYFAARLLGPSRGTVITAGAGAIVSSTAVTAALAQRMRDSDGGNGVFQGGIAVASAVMFLRVMVLTGFLAPLAMPTLVLLAAPGLLVSAVAALWFLWAARRDTQAAGKPLTVRNPFAIGPALLLMGLVMIMTLAAHWALGRYGSMGLAPVLALSGMIDVDSAIITMGQLPQGSLDPVTAGLVLLPPIVLNTLFKAGVALSVAGWRKGAPAIITLLLSALACGAAAALVLHLA